MTLPPHRNSPWDWLWKAAIILLIVWIASWGVPL